MLHLWPGNTVPHSCRENRRERGKEGGKGCCCFLVHYRETPVSQWITAFKSYKSTMDLKLMLSLLSVSEVLDERLINTNAIIQKKLQYKEDFFQL